MICMNSALNYTNNYSYDLNSNRVKAQRIVKVLIFMIMDNCAVVQSADDMELWRYVEQFRRLTPVGGREIPARRAPEARMRDFHLFEPHLAAAVQAALRRVISTTGSRGSPR